MIIEKILRDLEEMSPVNQKIAKYVLENKDHMGFLTVTQIQERLKVSRASVVRFARQIGYNGFLEMKKSIQKEIRDKLDPYKKIDITRLDVLSKKNQFENLVDNEINNIKKTIEKTEIEGLIKSIELIENAEKIFISGFGLSKCLSGSLTYALTNVLFKPVQLITGSFSDFIPSIKLLDQKSCMIIITFPPYSKETLYISKNAKEKEASQILITDSKACTIYKNADAAILCESNSLVLNNSLVSPIAMSQILINMLVLDSKKEGRKNLGKVAETEYEAYKTYTEDF